MKPGGIKTKTRQRTGIVAIGIFALAICLGTPARATESEDEYKLDRSFFIRLGQDFREVIRSPSSWGKRDILTLTAVSGTGLLLFAFDEDIQDWAQDRRSPSSDKAASIFSFLGNGSVLFGLSGAAYAAGEISHNPGLRRTALLSLESLAAASIIVWTIKFVVGRARPYTDESARSFHPFSFKNSYWSFPSGHAIVSFSVATTIAEQTKSPLIDILLYGLAASVAYSRVHENKHWASDVFIGSALGYFIGKKISGLNRQNGLRALRLGLDCLGGRRALTLSVSF